MTPKEFGQALRRRQRLYGTQITSISPRVVEAMKGAGLDFVFIDTEHTPIDRVTVSWMCQAYRNAGLPPMVRIPEPDPYQACMVLDGGAACVKVPYVETAEQARQMVGATKFRPFKGKRLESLLSGEKPAPHVAEYIRTHNENFSLVLNIESVAGMENLGEILAVPGVDGIIIGPHDLSCSIDAPEDYRGPAFDAATRKILARCRDAGISAGLHVHHADCVDNEIAWANAGANIILHSADLKLFRQTLVKDITRLRDTLGDKQSAGGSSGTF